jgi:Tfp pilus assembly pilus retraction ATPase PilT
MDFGTKAYSVESAEREYVQAFGEEGKWFLLLVQNLKKFERKHDVKITDVLVNNGNVFLGVLKNYFDLQDFIDDPIEVSEEKVKNFVRKYCELTGRKERSVMDFALNFFGYGIFRINYSNSVNGPVLNVRVLDFRIPDLIDDLDCPQYYVRFLENEVLRPEKLRIGDIVLEKHKVRNGGLILHAGETGSGKTTFIASELQFIADRIAGLIVTYEKPVEYRFLLPYSTRVIQYDLDFCLCEEDIYNHFLRSSPNIGFFYEIKNRDEFEKVLDLASRGHLIFTTVHASNVYEVFSSFGYFSEEVKQLFFSVLRAIVCHKLVSGEKGRIFPLYEIFINSDEATPVMNMFMRGEFIKLKNFLYKEKACKSFVSFTDYLKSFRKVAVNV